MENKLPLTCYTFLFVFCISILSANNANAQERGIYELVNSTSNIARSSKKATTSTDRNEFYNLAQKLHTTLYFDNNKLKNKYGNGAPVKITLENMTSFSVLNKKDANYNDVELITITLKQANNLNTPLDLSQTEYPKLRYIYIKCLFECNARQIEQFVKAPNNEVRIFYTSIRPS